MKGRAFPWLELIIVVIALGGLLLVAYGNLRRQQAATYFDTYSAFDARHGGYRAWYELLQREGVAVERFEARPAFLDESVSTLILAYNLDEQALRGGSAATTLNAGDFDALARWVKAGGRLVWLTDSSFGDEFGVPAYASSGPKSDRAVSVAPSRLTHGVDAVSGEGSGRVPFDRAPAVSPLVADDTGAVVVEYRFGKGEVVEVTDQTLFNNAHLGKADNARLAYNLAVAGGRPRGFVAFDEQVHGHIAGDSWWTILPTPVRIGSIIAGCALLLLVLGTAFRFGPTARLPREDERTSAEYLHSMATLFRRGRAARKAVRDLVDIALREVASAVGLPERADVASLARRLRMSPTGAENADIVVELDRLRGYLAPTPKELVRAARLCATLRKEYSRYGRFGIGRRPAPARRSA